MARQTKSKISVIGKLRGSKESGFTFPIELGGDRMERRVPDFDPDHADPVSVGGYFDNLWVFKRKIIKVEGYHHHDEGELATLIKHEVLKGERAFDRIRKEVEAFENLERVPMAVRAQIPPAVRLFVWQRDGGKCVECGIRDRLEFDHIIPVIAGGSSTERNVQLLCEGCNRKKGKKI